MKSLVIFLALLAFLLRVDGENDNRIKPGYGPGDPFPDDKEEVYPSETDLRAKISESHDADLISALNPRGLRLKWQRRVALYDADYILCLFESDARVEPGNNPRVLILLTPAYQVKTWGRFTCEPGFAFGAIINQRVQRNTYFVTVNPQGRFGGVLWFEKYLISASGIQKLGEGPEITKIADIPKPAK